MWVTTKANAPGGKRTEKVGLPYDPDLFDHMVEHGVYIEVSVTVQSKLVARTSDMAAWMQQHLLQETWPSAVR